MELWTKVGKIKRKLRTEERTHTKGIAQVCRRGGGTEICRPEISSSNPSAMTSINFQISSLCYCLHKITALSICMSRLWKWITLSTTQIYQRDQSSLIILKRLSGKSASYLLQCRLWDLLIRRFISCFVGFTCIPLSILQAFWMMCL